MWRKKEKLVSWIKNHKGHQGEFCMMKRRGASLQPAGWSLVHCSPPPHPRLSARIPDMLAISYTAALKICDTFDKSAVKNSLWVFVFLRPRYSLRFPRPRLFIIYLFFLKLSSKMFPLNGPRYYGVRWGKQLRVRRHESRPAVPLRWLARKVFFWPIRRRDFKRFWNSFGKSKCPGALPLLL